MKKEHVGFFVLILVAVVILFPDFAEAASDPDNIPFTDYPNKIIYKFKSISKGWHNGLKEVSKYYVGVITVFAFVMSMLKQISLEQDRSVQGIISSIGINLFWALLAYICIDHSFEWVMQLLKKFEEIASIALGGTPVELNPSGLINIGLRVVHDVYEGIDGFKDAILTIPFLFVAFFILMCFLLMAAQMTVIICMVYIVASIGILLVAFMVWQPTRGIALDYAKYALATAFKLLTMQLIVSVGTELISTTMVVDVTFDSFCILACASFIMLVMFQMVPEQVALMVGGMTGSGGNAGSSINSAFGAASGGAAKMTAATVASFKGGKGAVGLGSTLRSAAKASGGMDGNRALNTLKMAKGAYSSLKSPSANSLRKDHISEARAQFDSSKNGE